MDILIFIGFVATILSKFNLNKTFYWGKLLKNYQISNYLLFKFFRDTYFLNSFLKVLSLVLSDNQV